MSEMLGHISSASSSWFCSHLWRSFSRMITVLESTFRIPLYISRWLIFGSWHSREALRDTRYVKLPLDEISSRFDRMPCREERDVFWIESLRDLMDKLGMSISLELKLPTELQLFWLACSASIRFIFFYADSFVKSLFLRVIALNLR